MPRHQTFKDRNPTENLKRFSRAMHPMQFVREIYQNALDAGATKLRAYLEPQYLTQGAKKLTFADNGPGMTAHEMANYLGQYNSSSKSTGGVHDNFGIGVKATTLINNPYGVVFISFTEESPEGNMMWFTYDEELSEVSVKPAEYIYGDDEEDIRCLDISVPGWSTSVNVVNLSKLAEAFPNGWEGIKWWECKEAAKIKITGTIVMMLGDSAEADSLPASWSQPSLSYYMSWRYESLKVHCSDSVASQLETTSSTSNRSLGLLQVIDRYIIGQDSIHAPNGTQVDVYYVDVPKKTSLNFKTNHYCSSRTYRGFSAIAYNGELYHSRGDKINARSWGITADDVIEKIIIIVRPPILGVQADGSTRGVYPNDLRDRLLWQDSSSESEDKDFDLDAVKRWFVENQPKRLMDMIEKADAEDSSISRSQRAKELLKKYATIFKHRSSNKGDRVTQDAQGDRPLPAGPSQVLQAPKKIHPDFMPKQTEADPKGRIDDGSDSGKKGRLKRSKTEVEPKFKWLHADHENVKDLLMVDGKSYPVFMSKQGENIEVILNEDHEMFEAVYKKVCDEYSCPPNIARDAVKEFYATDLCMYVYHVLSLKGIDFTTFATREALYIRLLGTVWTIYPNAIRSVSKKGFHKKKDS